MWQNGQTISPRVSNSYVVQFFIGFIQFFTSFYYGDIGILRGTLGNLLDSRHIFSQPLRVVTTQLSLAKKGQSFSKYCNSIGAVA